MCEGDGGVRWQCGKKTFLPQMALDQLDAISQGPKNSRIPGPNPLPLALIMDMQATKTYARGCINHRCINSYYFRI